MPKKFLNLACGGKLSTYGDWTNIDFVSPAEGVIEANILDGLPFEVGVFDAVYCSNFIEHVDFKTGVSVLNDVHRILKPEGIVRLVTPDLEEWANTYLNLLQVMSEEPSSEKIERLEWIKLELFDQMMRDVSGGDSLPFMSNCSLETKAFIISRLGKSAKDTFSALSEPAKSPIKDLLQKLMKKWQKLPSRAAGALKASLRSKDASVGAFRRSGEVHRYMYDYLTLERALREAGFQNIERKTAEESGIENWQMYGLDIVDGQVDAPLGLFVEAKV